MPGSNWSLLKVFDSEAEARVVESFMKAKGFTVELLGVYAYGETGRGTMAGNGLRLMVLENEFDRAKKALDEV